MTFPAKPSLSDIAAMPFPASRDAMRKYYDPRWGKDESLQRPFRLTGEVEIVNVEHFNITVFAESEDEAKKAAQEELEKETDADRVEVTYCSVKPLEPEQ